MPRIPSSDKRAPLLQNHPHPLIWGVGVWSRSLDQGVWIRDERVWGFEWWRFRGKRVFFPHGAKAGAPEGTTWLEKEPTERRPELRDSEENKVKGLKLKPPTPAHFREPV